MRGKKTVMLLFFVMLLGIAPIPPDDPVLNALNGIAILSWNNDIQATSIAVFNVRNAVCPYPVVIDVEGGAQRTVIPEGPPHDQRCLLKAGDELYLIRYRDRKALDQLGPYRVPYRVWVPVVVRGGT